MNPDGPAPELIPDLFSVGAEALVRNAQRLGLTWRLRMGTVTTSQVGDYLLIRLDGDEASITALNMGGPVAEDGRVYVITVPPAGNFVVGSTFAYRPKQLLLSEVFVSTIDLTLTTAAQLVPGCTTIVNSIGDFEYDVLGIYDFDETSVGTTVALGELYINGVAASTSQAIFEVTAVTHRATVAQQWHGTGTNGDEFELRGRKSVNVGTVLARTPHTTMGIRIYQ